MFFADRCSREFSAGVESRGREYFREGRVEIGPAECQTLTATVHGLSGTYEVFLDWSEARSGVVNAACDCPYFEEYGACKHIWATMLAADARSIGPTHGKRSLVVLEVESDDWGNDGYLDDDLDDDLDEELDEFDDPSFFGRSYGVSARSTRSPSARRTLTERPGRKASWHEQLSGALGGHSTSSPGDLVLPAFEKSREVWYVLDVTTSLSTGDLVIGLLKRETKRGGHGLNLTAADYVFILDPWWNPAVEAQAVDRAHRIGQTRRVFAYRLIARETVEEKIVELQKTKRDLADAIISAEGSMLRQLTAEDLQMLLS